MNDNNDPRFPFTFHYVSILIEVELDKLEDELNLHSIMSLF